MYSTIVCVHGPHTNYFSYKTSFHYKKKKKKKEKKTNRPKSSTDTTKKYFVYCLVLNEFPFLPKKNLTEKKTKASFTKASNLRS